MSISEKHTVSIIPARGGSRRLPGKNLLPLAGKPLLAWSIRSSLHCPDIDRTCVSTEDPEIASMAKALGAEVIDRPRELATDQAGTLEVLQHGLQSLEKNGPRADAVVLLQPTSPFRKKEDLSNAIADLYAKQASAVVSVSKVKLGPKWMFKVEESQLEFAFGSDFSQIRTQDQPMLWQPNGAIYVYSRANLMGATGYAWGEKVLPLCLEPPFDTDIDNAHDFQIAQAIAHAYNLNW